MTGSETESFCTGSIVDLYKNSTHLIFPWSVGIMARHYLSWRIVVLSPAIW